MDEIVFPIIGAESKLPIYIVGVGWHQNQNSIDRKNGYPYFQVIYCANGSGVLKIGTTEYQINSHQCFLLYPNEEHEYHAITEPWETHWIAFDGEGLQSLVKSLGFLKSTIYYLGDLVSLDDLWRQIILEAKSNHNERGFRCSALTYSFLVRLKGLASEEPSVIKDEKLAQLNTVLAYIDQCFNRDLSMEELTACVGISPQYLCKLFKKYLNMRPFEYVAKKRIQESKKLLVDIKLPEAEIAAQCGFNSFSYFCAIFKRMERITPTEFRRIYHI